MDLEGRVMLITGAARRIGRAIALRMADAGCALALHYHRSATEAEQTAEECRTRGSRVTLFSGDLSAVHTSATLVRDAVAAFGRLDGLICNAATFEPDQLASMTPETWQRTMDVNLRAPALLVQAAAPALREARGRVVMLCDAAAGRPMTDYLSYSVSKGGLETLVRVLARSLAPEVGVVGVAPGIAEWPEAMDAATRERLERRIPLQRAGKPEEVAALVHFLLREGDFITGAILPIDGGRHLA